MMHDGVHDLCDLFTPDAVPGDLGKSVISWANRTVVANRNFHAFKIRHCDLLSIDYTNIQKRWCTKTMN